MERVRTILTHGYPYPHEHSRHFMIRKTIKPNYSNFSRWYVDWIFLAELYHLPSFQSMGLDLRMNLSFILAICISSLVFLIVFHVIFLGLWYLGLVSRMGEKKAETVTIIQNFAVISIACCVYCSHCGNKNLSRDKSIDRRTASWVAFSLSRKQNELASNGSEHSSIISPVYSLWATFIGLYMANYVVERSTGLALTHPLTIPEYENLKKLLIPDFEDMVPWYSWTSTDLFKTVSDLMISVTLFVVRFDMRMMQAAMNRSPDESKSSDLLYDHLDGKDEIWFDFIADTGDGGNSTYAIARLLAQPCLVVKSDDSGLIFPRGQLLLIGVDLAYPNPCSFTYEHRFFRPFDYALQPPAWYTPEHIALEKPELPLGDSELRQYSRPQCFTISGNHVL